MSKTICSITHGQLECRNDVFNHLSADQNMETPVSKDQLFLLLKFLIKSAVCFRLEDVHNVNREVICHEPPCVYQCEKMIYVRLRTD